MSRIAWAWSSDRSNRLIRLLRAVSTSARLADRLDHLVEVVEGDLEALEDVGPGARLLEVELGPPPDDLAAVVDVVAEDALERQRLRLAVDEREHVEVERRLHRRVLEQVVQHLVRVRVALDLDVDPHPVAVGLVAQVADPVELLVLDEVGDLLEQRRLVHLVRQLADDDRRAVAGGPPRTRTWARMTTRPRPWAYISRIASIVSCSPVSGLRRVSNRKIVPPVGKSGPLTIWHRSSW